MNESGNDRPRDRRSSPLAWWVGGALIAVASAAAFGGSLSGIDRNGSSNADVRPAEG